MAQVLVIIILSLHTKYIILGLKLIVQFHFQYSEEIYNNCLYLYCFKNEELGC